MSNIIDLSAPVDPKNLVTTQVGLVPEEELEVQLSRRDEGEAWTITRTCVYKGSLYPNARGQIVRQDVWVTMKNGLKSQAAQPT